MLELKLVNEAAVVESCCKQCKTPYDERYEAYLADSRGEVLGYCVFYCADTCIHVIALFCEEPDDHALADGLIRAVLHYGQSEGVTEYSLSADTVEALGQAEVFMADCQNVETFFGENHCEV